MFDLSLSAEQEQLLDTSAALFEKESTSERVRESEPLGFSPVLWKQVYALGLTSMSLPEDAGGGGAGLLDAVLVTETAGRFLAPVPLAESIAASRLLAELGTEEATKALRRAVEDGAVSTLAVVPAASPTPGASWVPTGASWVPAGAVAEVVVIPDGETVLLAGDEPPGQALPNLGSLPLAHRSLAGAHPLAQGPEAVRAAALALDDWRALTAAWLVGAGLKALEISVAYTTERKAFGAPIASYQSVAHRMADVATALDGAQLLVRKAAWAADSGDPRGHELALMALSFAAEAAEVSATEALHFHGGYGYMLEYDAQLYLRRVKAVGTLVGDPARELQRLADALWGAPVAS